MALKIKPTLLTKITMGTFLLFLILNGAYYLLLGLNIQFLKAESGIYLANAGKVHAEGIAFIIPIMKNGYNGHFAPLTFLAEFWQSQLFGTHETYWFWRQMIVVSLFMTCISFFSISLAMLESDLEKPTIPTSLAGISIAVIFGFQPIVTTLVSWPFMAIQLFCLSLAILSFLYLIKFSNSNSRTHLWLALVLAYSTMHVFGTGLAISVSVLFTATILIALRWYVAGEEKSVLRQSLTPVFVLLAFTIIHTVLMVRSVGGTPPSESVSIGVSIARYGAIFIELLHTSLRSIWAQGGILNPEMRGMGADSCYGWGLIFILSVTMFSLMHSYLKTPSEKALSRITITMLPTLTLIIIVGMITYRIRTEPSNNVLIGYINTDRYLIFSSFCGLVFIAGLYLISKVKLSASSAAAFLTAAIVCVCGNAVFMHKVPYIIWPEKLISHTDYWNGILNSVKDDTDYQSANWNQSMKTVTDFDITPLTFQQLIENDLEDRGQKRP